MVRRRSNVAVMQRAHVARIAQDGYRPNEQQDAVQLSLAVRLGWQDDKYATLKQLQKVKIDG